ncbi:MAG: RelA/SpoT domain-containing protein [Euryarchaeota archaeon]|nr:RelA/SpoT domain-containing protein [Euryarchaeota archaeon]
MEILNNWRSCHRYPINTFQATLHQKVEKIDSKAFVAQRLKRTPAIISKLQRFTKMKFSRMQDIGGLRVVVATLKRVYELEESYKQSRFKHKLVTERDYIQNPKSSGYRSVHMVYKYHNDSAAAYDGLLLELQIRTRLQHAWATAAETMGTFINYALKSSEGPEE